MVSERYTHLALPLKKLKNIHERTSSALLRIGELRTLGLELKKILDYPLLVQLIDLIEVQNRESVVRQHNLEPRVLAEFAYYEEELRYIYEVAEMPNQIVRTLPDSMDLKGIPLVRTRHALLRDAYRDYIKSLIMDAGMSGLVYLTIEDRIDDFLLIPNFIAWEREVRESTDRTIVLRSIMKIRQFEGIARTYDAIDNLKIDVQRVSSYCLEKLVVSSDLVSLKITSIHYIYTPKKGQLKLYVNERHIDFSGTRASLLKKALEVPSDLDLEPDIEEYYDILKPTADPKKAYDALYRQFSAINTRIAEELVEFGIIDFISIGGYEVRVNPLYAHLIVQ